MKYLISIVIAILLASCVAVDKPENAFDSISYNRTIIENSVVYIASSTNHTQHGSGLVIDSRVIVTAKHVIEAILSTDSTIQIRTKAGKVITSRISAALSNSVDIGILFLTEDMPVTPVPLTCRRAVVGEKIFSVGHPLTEEWIYTFGYISQSEADPQHRQQTTTMPVASGLSGAPVWNSVGQVVGLVDSFLTLTIPNRVQSEKAGRILVHDTMKAGFSLIIPADAICSVYESAKRAIIEHNKNK